MQNVSQSLEQLKKEQVEKLEQRCIDGILERENAEFLIERTQNVKSK